MTDNLAGLTGDPERAPGRLSSDGMSWSGTGSPEAETYDFRRPHRVSKERLRTLQAMYERLVKSLESWLIGRVRGQVELQLESIAQLSFAEFTGSLPSPCASYIFDIRDSGGQHGVIDFGHEFCYFLIDRMFGGSGSPTLMSRGLTPLERMVVRAVADRVTGILEEIWRDHIELGLKVSAFESAPDILQVANKEDPVLVANVAVMGGGTKSQFLICLPFSVLDKFFVSGHSRRINSATGSERERLVTRELAEMQLRATRLPVTARLPEFRMTMRDLAQVTVGGVLGTGIPREALLKLFVNGQERFSATAGRVGRKLAVRVHEPISGEPIPELAADDPSSLLQESDEWK